MFEAQSKYGMKLSIDQFTAADMVGNPMGARVCYFSPKFLAHSNTGF